MSRSASPARQAREHDCDAGAAAREEWEAPPPRGVHGIFALASGVAVANLYYAQPLLAAIASALHVAEATASLLLFCTQIGYAAGILLFVPLGDVYDRRRLVPTMMVLAALALLLCALAPTFYVFCAAILLVGLTTVSGQILVAFSADLSHETSRGRAVGTVVGGLLVGIVGARFLGGVIGGALGWRAVFAIASGLNLLLAFAIWRLAPPACVRPHLPYPTLLRSVGKLVRTEPRLRVSMAFGFVSMAGFNLFWTGATLLLSGPRYRFSPGQIGAVSALGLLGALVAWRAGRLHDSGRSSVGSVAAWALMLGAWLACLRGNSSLAWLLVAVVMLDVGTQSQRILNQSRALSLSPAKRSRANTAYISGNFIGAAAGSLTAAELWRAEGWWAVALVGVTICLLALAAQIAVVRDDRDELDARRRACRAGTFFESRGSGRQDAGGRAGGGDQR